MKDFRLYIILLSATCLALAGCDGEDSPSHSGAAPAHTVTMSIGSRAFVQTADNELINSWWMAFVAPDGTVVQTIDRSEAHDTQGQMLPRTAVERETFNVSLPDGIYRVYAFANFTGSSPSANIWGIKKGEKMPDLDAASWATGIDNDSNIPMTGFNTITVPATESSTLVVEVVRMFAKLQFDFKSTSSSQGKILKSIKVHNAQTSKIKLLPDYASLAGGAPSLPTDATDSALEYTGLNISLDAETSFSRYIFESTAATHPTGHYVLEFDIENRDHPGTETLTALAYQLDHITRNDYIVIPVTFTDWSLRLDVHFYPPIGGYPAVIVDSKGDEFYARFGSSGLFEITPRVTAGDTGAAVPSDKYTVTISPESGSNIFSRIPVCENGEIVGELAEGQTGTAVLNLDITVSDDALRQTFTRKLFIIRS